MVSHKSLKNCDQNVTKSIGSDVTHRKIFPAFKILVNF